MTETFLAEAAIEVGHHETAKWFGLAALHVRRKAAVSSVEPLSTTTIGTGSLCSPRLARHASRSRRRSRVQTTTVPDCTGAQ